MATGICLRFYCVHVSTLEHYLFVSLERHFPTGDLNQMTWLLQGYEHTYSRLDAILLEECIYTLECQWDKKINPGDKYEESSIDVPVTYAKYNIYHIVIQILDY